MTRLAVSALVLAVAVAVSVPAAALHPAPAAGTPGTALERATNPVETGPNTPRILVVGTSPTTGHATTNLSVGTTLDADAGSLRGQFRRYVVAEHLADADRDNASVIASTLDRLAADVDALRDRERAAYRAYAGGALSTSELLRRLAEVHADARSLAPVLDRLDDANAALNESLSNRLHRIDEERQTLTGPLRGHVHRTLAGLSDRTRIYVEATEAGVTLATVADGTYVRETVRADNHDDVVATDFSRNTANQRFRDVYPWALSHFRAISVNGGDDVYCTEIDHAKGHLAACIDGSTGGVFREVQRLNVDRVPVETVTNATDDGLEIELNRTYPGGPVEVGVRSVPTGDSRTNVSTHPLEPVNATVTVGGTVVGSTGSDGDLWAVAPRTPYVVSANTTDASVNVTAVNATAA